MRIKIENAIIKRDYNAKSRLEYLAVGESKYISRRISKMKLVYVKSGEEVRAGDRVEIEDGEFCVVESFPPPTSSNSSGKVVVLHGRDVELYFVSVIGAEWIEREDRIHL